MRRTGTPNGMYATNRAYGIYSVIGPIQPMANPVAALFGIAKSHRGQHLLSERTHR
jgi:hypothetical protein